MAFIQFPKDFLWGVSTSAYQIEGGWNEDNKGESIWDRYVHSPFHVLNNDNADVACDHYHRMVEDVALLKQLGVNTYHFSTSWSRVLPNGTGSVNNKGLDFYNRLVDELLGAGIKPLLTLYHWDLPQSLQNGGGWVNRETVEKFVEYALVMMNSLADRVPLWVTHNEPRVAAFLGYGDAVMAPGIADFSKAYQVAHHLLLAHGQVVQEFRKRSFPGEIGIVIDSEHSVPATETAEDVAAWKRYYQQDTVFFTEALLKGNYPSELMDWIGEMAPIVHEGDMDLISQPIDFLGVNYYRGMMISYSQDGGFLKCSVKPITKSMWGYTQTGWGVHPDGLKEVMSRIRDNYGNIPLMISENGCATEDVPDEEGWVDDLARIDFHRMHISSARKALDAGINLKGYYVWSILDNFEWSQGYDSRFGLVRIEPGTLNRIPKRSFGWYKQLIADNGFWE